jgi:hypothetical protein
MYSAQTGQSLKERKQNMKKWTAVIIMALMAAGSAQAVLVAYEDFDYDGGQSLTSVTNNNGTGWTAAWESPGIPGMSTSSSGKSLYFGQTPDLITDGSTHVWSESNKGNDRDFNTAIDLASQTMYFTVLFRTYGTGAASTVDMRAEFYDGASATGNMRANVGISDGGLFAEATTSGYFTSGDNVLADAVADDTTYLLAMKRTGSAISASLITADGDADTLASEPVTWQVSEAGASGVDLTSIKFIMAGSENNGLLVDEMRIATDWDSAVNGMVIPEPATIGMLGLGALLTVVIRRFRI